MKRLAITLIWGALLSASVCHAEKLVYLSCELVDPDGKDHSHFDFTLDEQNGTVSYFVKAANALNKPKAVFGPDKVTWSEDTQHFKITRSIDRVSLTMTQETMIGGKTFHSEGKCSITTPPERKF